MDEVRRASRAPVVAAGVVLLLAAVVSLFYYKWGGAIRTVGRVGDGGPLNVSTDALVGGDTWASIANYFQRIWPALTFGILIGTVVRATVSPQRIAAMLGGGSRSTLAAVACGAPLMLCSCCVTPVFTGVYERGARLGPALSLMMASPGLNIAAIALTFMVMPTSLAVTRVLGALVLVFVAAPIVGRLHPGKPPSRTANAEADTPAALGVRLARSLVYMIVVTVPLIVVGVAASALLLPHAVALSDRAAIVSVVAVAFLAVLVALPTFVELPIALLLLTAGAPGAAMAVLVAGPITNLPSLLVLARETKPTVALALAGSVFVVACAAGLAVSL